MLDKGTMEWLMKRDQIEIANGLYYCAHCGLFSDNYSVFTGYCIGEYSECPLVSNYRDAAEFEARVAEKLVEKIPMVMRMALVKDSDYVMPAETALYLARIEVEEEIDRS